jgi:hypothetical protein
MINSSRSKTLHEYQVNIADGLAIWAEEEMAEGNIRKAQRLFKVANRIEYDYRIKNKIQIIDNLRTSKIGLPPSCYFKDNFDRSLDFIRRS